MRKSHGLRDLAFACGLFLLLLIFFWPVTVGNRTLLPADVLYQFQPWRNYAGSAAPVPQNRLVSDLIFENYAWKKFILDSLRARQLPLWNPYIMSGLPFLAAGQHSALYPFSLIYYVFPLARAYGLFTVSQLLLAGLSLYYLARTLRLSRFASAAGGLIFAFSGFLLVSTVFPMIIATAAWLPFLLAMVERLLQASRGDPAQPWRERLRQPLPWLILGSLGLGLQFLAGHIEFYYYNLLVLAAYAAWRAIGELLPGRRWRSLLLFSGALGLMVVLGMGLGAVQVVPYLELVTGNARQGSATYEQIVGWAFPRRHVLAFLMPDFFGNPTHHAYTDLFSLQTVTAWRSALGQRPATIEWGMKNYVEGGAYVSILGLLLALVGVLRRPRRQAWFFVALALFSLSLAFGLPTYHLLFWLPGIPQLHSPFRWVFPYTVSVAILAAMGVEALAGEVQEGRRPRLPSALGALSLVGALAVVAGLALARAFPQYSLPLADRAVAQLARAARTFADGRMFLSYEARNLALFALCLFLAGAALLWPRLRRPGARLVRSPWPYALLALLALDPALWYRGFQPAVDPAPLAIRPALVDFLQQDKQPFRITVYDTKDAKPLPPNTNMYFGLDDVRGYDSNVPRQYYEVMSLVGKQELEYNQIARLTDERSLDSPILDLLNVRYVVTRQEIRRPNYTLVYSDTLRVYRNDDALPRAFVTFGARTFSSRADLLAALPQADPRQAVLLEQTPEGWAPPGSAPVAPEVQFVENSPNEVRLHVDMPAPGFLVLADNYYPGWVAYTQADGQPSEQALTILRADGTVRAVQLPAGAQTVRFKYSPGSLKTGLFISFLAGVSLFLLAAFWVWARAFVPRGDELATRRVAKNTVAPLTLQLLNKGIDTAFAMLMLRLLGPDNQGKYYFAVYVALLLGTVTSFGLNTLLTREVAKNRDDANRYLWNSTILRLVIAALAAPLLLLFLLLYRPMPKDTALAIILLAVGLVPSSISEGLSAVFMAFEVMVIPAVVSTVTTLFKVGIGAAVLLMGWGFIGLAGTSIVVNLITLAILLTLAVTLFFRPHPQAQRGLQRQLVSEAYPLMVNNLLATLFFKVDVFLVQRVWGDAVLGWYSVSYKLVDAVGIIPPTFTMAIFPLMSRFASSSRESLHRAYILSIKLLFGVALFIALVTTALAYPLASLMGGSAYLPHSAIALEIIVWYMPLGFINSVTQYVLIALGKQRYLMGAFALGLAFSLGANVLLIPRYGYPAAAAVHIFSELALLIPFYVGVRRYLAPIPWLRILWRPSAAAAVAGALSWLLRAQPRLLVAVLAGAVYLGLALGLGTLDAADHAQLAQVIPLDRLWQRLRRAPATRPTSGQL